MSGRGRIRPSRSPVRRRRGSHAGAQRRAAPPTSLSVETTARLCVPRPTSPALSAAEISKRKSFPSRPTNLAVAVTVTPGGVAAVWTTSTETPTETSPSRRWGLKTRAAATSMRPTMRDVAKTGGKESPGSRFKTVARSEGPTVSRADAVESTAGSLIGMGLYDGAGRGGRSRSVGLPEHPCRHAAAILNHCGLQRIGQSASEFGRELEQTRFVDEESLGAIGQGEPTPNQGRQAAIHADGE